MALEPTTFGPLSPIHYATSNGFIGGAESGDQQLLQQQQMQANATAEQQAKLKQTQDQLKFSRDEATRAAMAQTAREQLTGLIEGDSSNGQESTPVAGAGATGNGAQVDPAEDAIDAGPVGGQGPTAQPGTGGNSVVAPSSQPAPNVGQDSNQPGQQPVQQQAAPSNRLDPSSDAIDTGVTPPSSLPAPGQSGAGGAAAQVPGGRPDQQSTLRQVRSLENSLITNLAPANPQMAIDMRQKQLAGDLTRISAKDQGEIDVLDAAAAGNPDLAAQKMKMYGITDIPPQVLANAQIAQKLKTAALLMHAVPGGSADQQWVATVTKAIVDGQTPAQALAAAGEPREKQQNQVVTLQGDDNKPHAVQVRSSPYGGTPTKNDLGVVGDKPQRKSADVQKAEYLRQSGVDPAMINYMLINKQKAQDPTQQAKLINDAVNQRMKADPRGARDPAAVQKWRDDATKAMNITAGNQNGVAAAPHHALIGQQKIHSWNGTDWFDDASGSVINSGGGGASASTNTPVDDDTDTE